MEAVDVLRGRDREQHPFGGNPLRQRELDEDAVDPGILVQRCDAREELALRGRLGKRDVLRVESCLRAGLHLVAHVYLRRRILADLDRSESGTHVARRERFGAPPQVGAQAVGQSGAVDDAGVYGGAVRRAAGTGAGILAGRIPAPRGEAAAPAIVQSGVRSHIAKPKTTQRLRQIASRASCVLSFPGSSAYPPSYGSWSFADG